MVSLGLALGACGDNSSVCGPGTTNVGGQCIADTTDPGPTVECGPDTAEVDGQCVSTTLQPGMFESPMVLLQRLAGINDHMHLDEVRHVGNRLYVCSYDFAVVNTTNAGNMRYLLEKTKVVWPDGQGFRARYPATGTRTGGCINLAVDGDHVYTTHRGNIDDPAYLGGWKLSTTGTSATQLPLVAEPGTSYEGIDVGNGHIYVGLGVDGFAVYDHDKTSNVWTRRGTLGGLNHVLGLRVVDNIVYAADGLGGLVTIDVTNPDAPALISRVAFQGQARDVRVDKRADRTTVYVAAAAAGLVVVDATDPANMSVIGQATMPGSAQRLDYAGDRVYVAAWNDARVFDVSTPASPKFIGAARMTRQLPGTTGPTEDGRPEVTSRVLGIAASQTNPDLVFVGNWHVPYQYRIHVERQAPFVFLPEEVNLLDFGPTEAGKTSERKMLVRNEGTAPLTLYNMWSSNPKFTIAPRQVRIPPGGNSTLTFTFASTSSDKENAIVYFGSDDPTQPVRKAYLTANLGGLGIGVPLPETIVALTDGGEWSSTAAEHQGKVQMLGYFATF